MPYQKCCGRYIDGAENAHTAEALMRSRYTAYTLPDVGYLTATWDASFCPKPLTLDDTQRWIGLKIIHVQAGSEIDDAGTVEFVARYKINGRAFRLHETSQFRQRGGRWFYLDGV